MGRKKGIFFTTKNRWFYPKGKRLEVFKRCKTKTIETLTDEELEIMAWLVNPNRLERAWADNPYAKELVKRAGYIDEWERCETSAEASKLFHIACHELLGMEIVEPIKIEIPGFEKLLE